MGAEQGLAHDSFIRHLSHLSNKTMSCRTSDCQQMRQSIYAPASSPGIPTKCLPLSRLPFQRACPVTISSLAMPRLAACTWHDMRTDKQTQPYNAGTSCNKHKLLCKSLYVSLPSPTIILAHLQDNFSDFCHTAAKGSHTASSVQEKASEVFLIGPCFG